MDEVRLEVEQAAYVAVDGAQGLARQPAAPLPSLVGEAALLFGLFPCEPGEAFGFGAFGGRGGGGSRRA
ncbi:hypothetical protein V5F01_01115 [Streptomyces sp. NRRL B-2790]|uniref:hypothetical protein n=1 Tax=Streptomyces sp. NRRL B-2790 TaxID=1463835 RepID=UPI0035677895